MSKNNKSKLNRTKKNKNKVLKWVLGFAGVLLIAIGFVSNTIPFTYSTIRCGRLPVESTTFMASYSYKLPGDYGYGIHSLSEYKFCTEAQIKATNGYSRANKYGPHKYER